MGGRPYGYSSFECRLTPYVKFGGADNVIAVRVDHSRFADSRWYTGSGIYRHVRLRITDPLCVGHWGTFVTAPRIDRNSALVRIETTVENNSAQGRQFVLHSEIIDDRGAVVGGVDTPAKAGADQEQILVQEITIARPQFWSIEAPALYKVRSRLTADSQPLDETSTPFGIRTIRFDPDKGFFLNDAP